MIPVIFLSYKIISGKYDKQNLVILKIKEVTPIEIKNKLKSTMYILRSYINKSRDKRIQKAKLSQGLNGNLIQSQEIISEMKTKFIISEYFLPFKRLDLNYGWNAIENSKRAHYLEIIEDKTIVVSGEGEFIYFETKNFNTNKLKQKILETNLLQTIKSEDYKLIGIRDLLIDEDTLYISVLLQSRNNDYTISILKSYFNINKLEFEFYFNTEVNVKKYSIGTGGRIVKFKNNKLLFSIGHFSTLNEVQELDKLVGKIITIDKSDQNYEVVSLGHRNPQGLFYYQDENGNEFILNSEHGPKGGDEININDLQKKELYNFGWPIASYGINYNGTNPFKPSHSDYGFDEPLIFFTPSIGISEISVMNNEDLNTIYASSLRAESIYLINTNKEFTEVFNRDRLRLKNRIRDIKYAESLGGHIAIFENTPSIALIKNQSN
jgi:hypothetical protein